jgi:Uncharacterised nucleotidyltransferase
MGDLPEGLLFRTIAPVLEEPDRQWCLEQWLQCSPQIVVQKTKTHKLLSTLEFCLGRHGLWEQVPLALRTVIQQSRQQQALRQLQILSQLQEIDTALAAVDQTAVLLKGSALLYYPLYADLGSRLQSDIDLLILPEQVPIVVNCFQNLGYSFHGRYEPQQHYDRHLPALVRPRSIHVELHLLHPASQQQFHPQIWHTAQSITDLQTLRLPTATELFWHIALHGWFGMSQLRNLLDLDQLRRIDTVHFEVLADRANTQNLGKIWAVLEKQLQEFALGQPTPSTVERWEWRPSPGLETAYSSWLSYGWRYLWQPLPTGYWPQALDKLLFLPVVARRLWRSLAWRCEYQFRKR